LFRAVSEARRIQVLEFLASDFYRKRAGRQIVETNVISRAEIEKHFSFGETEKTIACFLEHRKLSFISYPYEWPFSLLKRAALAHLALHLEALDHGFDMSDSSAFNIQFEGIDPIFIDTLSFTQYEPGSYWLGYKQFLEQFLCPLLLQSYAGLKFNDWYRGAVNGIDLISTSRALPIWTVLSPSIALHVHLHARMMRKVRSESRGSRMKDRIGKPLPARSLRGLLSGLRAFTASLRPHKAGATYWENYAENTGYDPAERNAKKEAVSSFVRRARPKCLLDLGCNTGEYSEIALAAGARHVIAADSDPGTLEAVVSRAHQKRLNITPIYLDLGNPSPSQGWGCRERSSILERANADALIALAVVHHLVIGGNVLLKMVVDLLIQLAPLGLIEFVPKSDPMVIGLLSHREDVFPDYDIDNFRKALGARALISQELVISKSGRTLFFFETIARSHFSISDSWGELATPPAAADSA
jgi:ribosomal protein L11 methylase PrmA